MVLRLHEPMLARAGAIPQGSGWTFEPKLDGFRCLVCTHALFRARSRRGWDMTHLLPEFRRGLPLRVQLDGRITAGEIGEARLSEPAAESRARRVWGAAAATPKVFTRRS